MVKDLPDPIGKSLMPMEGIELVYNRELCTLCGACIKNKCFVDALSMERDGMTIDKTKCRICGRCVDSCNHDGLTILMDSDTVKRSIEHVEKLVDVNIK